MNDRIATSPGNTENRSIAGRYVQPDWGSAANGTPPIESGFHTGMWPEASVLPRKLNVGVHIGRMSTCCDDTSPSKTNPRITITMQATIRAGPATAPPMDATTGGTVGRSFESNRRLG